MVLQQAFETLKSSGLQTEMDITWTTQDGRERILHWSNAPVLDESGKLKWIVDVFLDITDQHDSELQLTKATQELEIEKQIGRFLSEASYRMYTSSLIREKRLELLTSLVIPSIADWSFAVLQSRGPENHLKAAYHWDAAKSDSISKLLLWKTDTSIPKFISDAQSQDCFHNTNPLEASTPEEWALLKDLGWQFWMCFPIVGYHLLTRGALLLASGTSTRTTLRNNKQIAAEFVRRIIPLLDQASLYEDTMRAVKLRDEFISVVSHELRTPLTSLRMQLQLLKKRPDFTFLPSSKGQKLITDADRQLDRISKLVLEMLDTESISQGKLRIEAVEFDLQDLVRDVVSQLSTMASKNGVNIRLEFKDLITGSWDRFRMEQVVTIILMNAFKFGRNNPVDVRIRASQDKAFIEVEDRGPGIRNSDTQRIFERFEQISGSSSGGLGMGLYIARQIVRAHGGDITVESHWGKGSKFIVEVPKRIPAHASLHKH